MASIGVAILLMIWLFFDGYHWVILLRLLDKSVGVRSQQGYGVWRIVLATLTKRLREQRLHEWRLNRLLKLFSKAGEAIPDGVVILDEQDRIEWFNATAALQFSLNDPADKGSPLYHFIRQPAFQDYLHTAKSSSPPLVLQITSRATTELTLSIQLIPFDAKHRLVLSRDFTTLERAQTMRRDFIANISHELGTPLTVIGGFLETFAKMKTPDVDALKQYLPVMLTQSERMQTLLADLLTLSKLESDTLPAPSNQVDMYQLLDALWVEAESLSRGMHHFQRDWSGPRWLLGNYDELYSAFGNLVTNAIHYTPQDGTIALSWQQDNDRLVFKVCDTGIGIEEEHIARLTERFYRVDTGRSREKGGTGLGLSIAHHIALRHQAKLSIASEIDKGSCFSIIFPLSKLWRDSHA